VIEAGNLTKNEGVVLQPLIHRCKTGRGHSLRVDVSRLAIILLESSCNQSNITMTYVFNPYIVSSIAIQVDPLRNLSCPGSRL
jgi:hypothetical protein